MFARRCINEVMSTQRRKRSKKPAPTKGSIRPSRKQAVAPRTATQYHAKPEKFKDMWDRVVNVVSKMRTEKASLQRAARELGVSPRTVKRWAGSALQKRGSGKWIAKNSDTLLRVLTIPASDGTRELAVRGSKQATLLAEYWNAVHRYLQTGDASRLRKFEGQFIKDANGEQIPLPTNRKDLNRLASAGVLSFESLYARSA
jgi:hypothetical protein